MPVNGGLMVIWLTFWLPPMDSPMASWGKFPLCSWCFKSHSDGCFNLSCDRSKASATSRCTWCHPLLSGLLAKTAITQSSWSVTGIDDLQRFNQGNARGREKTMYFPSQCCKVNLKCDCEPTISSSKKMVDEMWGPSHLSNQTVYVWGFKHWTPLSRQSMGERTCLLFVPWFHEIGLLQL